MGMFQLHVITLLRSALKSEGSQIKKKLNRILILTDMQKTPKRLQNSKIATLKDLLQKAKEKLKFKRCLKPTIRWT